MVDRRSQSSISACCLAVLYLTIAICGDAQITVGSSESIQNAIDKAPASGAIILISPGTYREVLEITTPNITLRGGSKDPAATVVVFNRSAADSGATTKSSTVNVRADGFTAENITFANDWNRTHVQGQAGSQALAVLVTGDRAIFRNTRLLGNQDTLYAARGRQYFVDSYIEGNVDFIFGDARAFFERCEIHSTTHAAGGYITAQSRNSPTQDSAYIFDHCKLTSEPGQKRVYLGRPWRSYARVIFLNTEMGDHIDPAGWKEWHAGETTSLETAIYAEYQSSGPGARPDKRDPHSHQLTNAQATVHEASAIRRLDAVTSSAFPSPACGWTFVFWLLAWHSPRWRSQRTFLSKLQKTQNRFRSRTGISLRRWIKSAAILHRSR